MTEPDVPTLVRYLSEELEQLELMAPAIHKALVGTGPEHSEGDEYNEAEVFEEKLCNVRGFVNDLLMKVR